MAGTVAAIVVGVAAYLALSFAIAVVMGSMLRGAERSGAADGASLRSRERDRFVVPVVRPPLVAAGRHRDHGVAVLPRAVRARCRRAGAQGTGSATVVPLFRRPR